VNRVSSLAALALAAALVLTGCSSSAPTTDTNSGTDSGTVQEPTVAGATGDTVTGDGYSYRVPEGWAVPDEDIPGFTPDSVAADMTDTDGFADNVNVVLSPAGEVSNDLIESAGVDELEGAGATEVAVQPRVQVAGAESAHISARLSQGGTDYLIEQYYASHDGQTYVVTFSFSDTVSTGDRTAVAESVLATWAWA